MYIQIDIIGIVIITQYIGMQPLLLMEVVALFRGLSDFLLLPSNIYVAIEYV